MDVLARCEDVIQQIGADFSVTRGGLLDLLDTLEGYQANHAAKYLRNYLCSVAIDGDNMTLTYLQEALATLKACIKKG